MSATGGRWLLAAVCSPTNLRVWPPLFQLPSSLLASHHTAGAPEAPDQQPDVHITTRVSGPEPGYIACSIFVTQVDESSLQVAPPQPAECMCRVPAGAEAKASLLSHFSLGLDSCSQCFRSALRHSAAALWCHGFRPTRSSPLCLPAACRLPSRCWKSGSTWGSRGCTRPPRCSEARPTSIACALGASSSSRWPQLLCSETQGAAFCWAEESKQLGGFNYWVCLLT
jgi:hypothetical protein